MRILRNILLCMLVLSLASSCKKALSATVITVTPAEAAELMDTENVTLVDVRQSQYFADKHLENAMNISVEEEYLNGALDSLDVDQPILIYCNTGRRSARCSKILKDKGFKKIYDLEGGLEQWEASGRQVIVKTK